MQTQRNKLDYNGQNIYLGIDTHKSLPVILFSILTKNQFISFNNFVPFAF